MPASTTPIPFAATLRSTIRNSSPASCGWRRTSAARSTSIAVERRIAALFALGDRVTVRIVAPGDLAGVTAHGGDLVLTLTDLGARRLILRLGDAEAAQAWAARLERLLIRSTETQGGRSAAALAS